MELVVEPEVYCPSVGDDGLYIDKVPTTSILKKVFNVLAALVKIKYMTQLHPLVLI